MAVQWAVTVFGGTRFFYQPINQSTTGRHRFMAPPRRAANAPRAAKYGAQQSIMRISMPARHVMKKEAVRAKSKSVPKAATGKARKELATTTKAETQPQQLFTTTTDKPGLLSFDAFLLQNLTVKQQAAMSKDFREKVNKVGQSVRTLFCGSCLFDKSCLFCMVDWLIDWSVIWLVDSLIDR